MPRIYERNGLVVRDAPTRELGGPTLSVYLADGAAGSAHDADDVRDLRDELTEWLQRVGRDS